MIVTFMIALCMGFAAEATPPAARTASGRQATSPDSPAPGATQSEALRALPWVYFVDASMLNAERNGLVHGRHVLVNREGRVELIADKPITADASIPRVRGALLLPYLADGYSLVQERGLGGDEDVNEDNQTKMARYLANLGVGAFRDPIFPRGGLSATWSHQEVYAQHGYLDLPGGPGEAFNLIVKPEDRPEDVAARLPASGPVTLWWSQAGTDAPVPWVAGLERAERLIAFFRAQGRKVGAYIQDAAAPDLQVALTLPFDFYEGIPDRLSSSDLTAMGSAVWLPLAGLNDRRYCAALLEERLPLLGEYGLYDAAVLARVHGRLDEVYRRIADRCGIWRERREQVLDWVRRWQKEGGKLAVGSGGGHLFAFSGDVRAELDTWAALGLPVSDMLVACYRHTPQLLGYDEPYLQQGKLAHFVVYRGDGTWTPEAWLKRVGTRVDDRFFQGERLPQP